MSKQRDKKYGLPLARDLAWQRLHTVDLQMLAPKCGGHFDPQANTLSIRYLNLDVEVLIGESRITAQPDGLILMEEVLILRYLYLCDGTPPSGRWISLRDLPGGMQYFAPFFGRTGRQLAARFGQDAASFARGSRQLLADPLSFGDCSFLYRLLPKLWLGIVLHLGDEEFPPEVTILFDESVRHQFTTEDCVAAAQVLTRRLLRAATSC
ncbi:MAG: DUF3786 domain-containing protein [Anaerolineae bacterium]